MYTHRHICFLFRSFVSFHRLFPISGLAVADEDDEEAQAAETADYGVLVGTAATTWLKLCSNPIFERQLAREPTGAVRVFFSLLLISSS